MRIPGEKNDDKTFYWGNHRRVVKRPPRTDVEADTADPRQHDDVERWECLDCGFTAQGGPLGVTFSSRECPPEVGE
jgi:Zn ribbon nucleic-acid-binding protein